MPDRRSIFRLLALAGFLLTVALALWLAELRPLWVIIVMAAALLVAWTIEWLSWRQDMLRLGTETVTVGEEEAFALVPPPLAPPVPAEPVAPVPDPVQEAPSAPEPEPEPEPVPVETPAPEPPVPSLRPSRSRPRHRLRSRSRSRKLLLRPSRPPSPWRRAPRPVLRPVPPPPPPPPSGAPAPVPVRPAASRDVIDMRLRATVQPRRWNLWDLERRARDEAQRDPLRYEEWSYLFVHLRQFATPDGSLPVEFDDLVRESFGELLEQAG